MTTTEQTLREARYLLLSLSNRVVDKIDAALAAPTQIMNEWQMAIDQGLVCCHIGTSESFATAQEALDALIDWHVAVALDPAVSSDAQALIDHGMCESKRQELEAMLAAPAQAAEPIADVRDAFEAWARNENYDLTRYDIEGARDTYMDINTAEAFVGFRAALAAVPQAPAYQGPTTWAPEEQAMGNVGIRWVNAEHVGGRPTDHDALEYLENMGADGRRHDE